MHTDGRLITTTNVDKFFYLIDSVFGLMSIKASNLSNQMITSIVVTINVADVSLVTLPNVNCQVSFRFSVLTNPLVFIGGDYRSITLCEDLPIRSSFLKLAVFDSSFSMNEICFTILDNIYFDLIFGNNTSNGSIVLKRTLDYEYFLNNNSSPTVYFTVIAFFCNNPTTSVQQTVAVTIVNVNEYAPYLESQLKPLTISLSTSSYYLTNVLNIYDQDAYPFNKHKCFIQNDKSFTIINNQNNIIISYIDTNQPYSQFVDLAIKCCDDIINLTINDISCNPISKCTITPVKLLTFVFIYIFNAYFY